jgi:hypothetical protein
MMVPKAPLEQTEHGLMAAGKGWFLLNLREARSEADFGQMARAGSPAREPARDGA